MGFKDSTAISKIVVVTVAPRIIGVIYGFSRLQSGKQRNQFLGSTETTLQLNKKLRRWPSLPSMLCGAIGVLPFLSCGWPTRGDSWTR
jgi:hypothetical protein